MLDDRFWSKVEKSDGCWIWTSSRNHQGYGYFFHAGKPCRAHKLSYEECKGSVPAGLQLDHTCRNRSCVNPAHLEPVTAKENIRRAVGHPAQVNASKALCPKGHPYAGNNLSLNVAFGKVRGRRCLVCHRLREAARRAARSNQ